jgi:threonyl-tRNA synthetase
MKVLYNDGTVADCPADEEVHVIRHTAAHVMAQAVKRLYPEADFGFGPATDNGFYYDIDLGERKLTDEDLAAIEAEMKKIVKENLKVTTFELPRAEAIKLMEERGEKYKVEHIGDLPEDAASPSTSRASTSTCAWGRMSPTPRVKAFKLTSVRGLLEGRQAQQDAHAHQRHRLRNKEELDKPTSPARGGQEARPPQDRPGDGASS